MLTIFVWGGGGLEPTLTQRENRVIFHENICLSTQRSSDTPVGGAYTASLHTPAVPQSTRWCMPSAISYYGLQNAVLF